MRFKSSISPLLLISLPLLAIAAPNPDGDSDATTTQTSTAITTIVHTQMRATLTYTYSPSYVPLIAPTQSVSGPLPDIPNPNAKSALSDNSGTEIFVAPPSATATPASTSTKARSSVVSAKFPSGTGLGTITTPLVLASATNLATAAPPISTYTGGAAAARARTGGVWGSAGIVLVGVAVGLAPALL